MFGGRVEWLLATSGRRRDDRVLADDAGAIYRGLAAETWDALRDVVRRHADHQVAEIERPAADP